MPTFKYTAKDPEGHNVGGSVVADNKTMVVEELRKRKLIILDVQEVKAKAAEKSLGSKGGKGVKEEEIVIFCRQLATMVDAGIPIIQAVDALKDQVDSVSFRQVMTTVKEDIEHGNSLAVAFSKHPRVFDTLFVNMVRVGEAAGVLSAILDRIATYMEKSSKLKRKVKSALIYPIVVVSMAVLITVLLLVKVVPTFENIYKSFDKPLPGPTQILVKASNIVQHYFIILAALIGLIIFALKRWHKTEKGGKIIDGILLKIPILGEMMCKLIISQFTRTLATLVQSGVPILESLDIVGKTIGNRVIAQVIEDVKNHVREGESIGKPLEKSDIFPPMVTRMITVGEKSGQLEKMLLKIAEFFGDQVDAAVDGLTSILEPVIIVVLGVIVGAIVIALFLPILNMSQIV